MTTCTRITGTETVRICGGESHELHLQCQEKGTAVVMVQSAVEQRVIVDVAQGAELTVIIVVDAPQADVALHCEGSVAAGGSLLWQVASLAGASILHTIRSTAMGDSAHSAVDWIAIASGTDDWSLDVRNIFAAREGRGEVTMRAVAQDTARVRCGGIIDIRPGGAGTDTYLTQSVLMLDATAKIDAVPALEIHTDSVRASHSATVSRITPDDLFYLSSRGLPHAEARTLYIEGFVGELAQRIADTTTREVVEKAILRIGQR